MACGEGYGRTCSGRRIERRRVDANPEAFEHARLRYVRGNLSFARDLVEDSPSHAAHVVFLQTIEHIEQP